MAAAPAPADSDPAPPPAMLSTNGSISANPTIAASPKRPFWPNSLRAQVEASEIATKRAAKMNAALSSSGLAGGAAAASAAGGATLSRYQSAASATPTTASAKS